MNHYPHHIKDFNNATRHLNRLERSIYRDLIELYYDTEQQLPLDLAWICKRVLAHSNEEVTAVESSLNEFFTKSPTGYFHSRCDHEIEAYHANTSQRALAGKASALKRALKKQAILNGNSTTVETPLEPRATDDERQNNGASTNQSTNQPINQINPPTPQTGEGTQSFEKFWKAWPPNERKQDKAKCLKKWTSQKLESQLQLILDDINLKRKTQKWAEGFIEAPLVYLNGQRWKDGVQPDEPMATGALDPDSRAAVEARGVACGVGKWAEGNEQWGVYKNRVNAASRVEA